MKARVIVGDCRLSMAAMEDAMVVVTVEWAGSAATASNPPPVMSPMETVKFSEPSASLS